MKHFVLALTLLTQQGFAAHTQINVLSEIVVDSQEIFLKDILQIENITPELQKKINAVVIGDAPQIGEIRKLSSYAVSEIIRYNLKNMDGISLKIPNQVSVIRKGEKLNTEVVKKKIETWVESDCSPCEVEIESVRLSDVSELDPSMSWSIPTLQQIPKGQFTIGIDLYKKENFYKKIFVQGNLRIFKNIFAAKRDLAFGSKIQKEDFFIKKQDVTFSREVVPDESELLGSEVAQTIVSSQPIWKKNLKRKMAMQRGSPVQVIMSDSTWKIQISGLSQDSGYVGDTVRVLNPETKRIITGIVRDENLVEVR